MALDMELNAAGRELIGRGADATLVTLNPDGSPQVTLVWVALQSTADGDELVVASMDRLARSLVDLKQIVGEVTAKGASVEFVHERATYAAGAQDPRADLMLSLLGAFAEFERAIIRERQAEGIAIAKAKGKYKGRKRVLTDEQIAKARARIEAGEGPSAIARELGVGRSTLYRALQRVQAGSPGVAR